MQQELRDYLTLLQQRPLRYADHEMLTLVDDPAVLEAYSRQHQIRLGIVYRSRWHIYVVDLLRDKNGRLFPHERLLKAVTGSSVVVIPMRGEKVVLLRQFRHAMGDYQYCFPRGFAEEGVSPAQNAQKELREELNCRPGTPELLGRVVADSGVCGEPVWVFRCAIEDPCVDGVYENIASYFEVTLPELMQMVRSGQIDDGFTLSALALLRSADGL